MNALSTIYFNKLGELSHDMTDCHAMYYLNDKYEVKKVHDGNGAAYQYREHGNEDWHDIVV